LFLLIPDAILTSKYSSSNYFTYFPPTKIVGKI